MADKTTQEEAVPVEGQYTLFNSQEAQKENPEPNAQDAQNVNELHRILGEAHLRRMKMLTEETDDKLDPEMERMLDFVIRKTDEILISKDFLNSYFDYLADNPGTSLESYINRRERTTIATIFYLALKMSHYIEDHPEETLDTLWDNHNPESEAWQSLRTTNPDKELEDFVRNFWAPQKGKKNTREIRNKAIEKGALMALGRLASYSVKGFENTLNITSIYKLPDEAQSESKPFDDDTGELSPFAFDNKDLLPINNIHMAFLMALNQVAIETIEAERGSTSDSNGVMSVYLPSFCRDIGLDPRSFSSKRGDKTNLGDQRATAVLNILRPWEKYIGRTPDGRYWRLVTLHGYDPETEIMTFSAPYLYELRKAEALQGEKALNRLLYGSVVNEPNRAAVELANRILDGLLQRGTRPDYNTYKSPPINKKTQKITKADGSKETVTTVYKDDPAQVERKEPIVTYEIKFSSLISDCPQFMKELQEIEEKKKDTINPRTGKPIKSKPAVAFNAKLRNTFDSAIKIIMTKSDAPNNYVDLTIGPIDIATGKFMPPTKSTLSHKLIITHKGRPKKQ